MLEKSFEALKSYDFGTDRNEVKPIEEAVVATHGDAAARKELEGQLVAALASELSLAAKQFLCRQLRIVGTATSVPALAKLLSDPKLSHMARYALEDISGPEAAAAMRDATGNVDSQLKIGMLSSLGVRQDEASIPLMTELLGSDDAAVGSAAAIALGAVGSPAAAKALEQGKPSAEAQSAATDASFTCAENLLADGKNMEALAIYKTLAKGDPPKHVKLAATRGMLACAGKK